MKAKSHSRKKLNKNQLVDHAANYIINWTKQELKKFNTQPVVIQTGDYEFLVGKYRIKGISKKCWSVHVHDQLQHDFTCKANAILYSLCETNCDFDAAKDLLELDNQIGKLETDLEQYKHTLALTKDKFKTELYFHRYLHTKYQYQSLNEILKKTLKSAKYTKFGKQPL